jgi:hypothetical protein
MNWLGFKPRSKSSFMMESLKNYATSRHDEGLCAGFGTKCK